MISERMNATATGPANAPVLTASDWARIETVLLDLDGTLLDLAFDNFFWRTRVPEAWARSRSLSPEQAQAELQPRFRAREGTLDWYCIDYWSRELELDIAALKHGDAHHIRWLPGAREFLGRVRESMVGAYEHQDLPFAKIVETQRLDRDTGRWPIYQIAFACPDPVPEVEAAGVVFAAEPTERRAARYDIEFVARAGPGGAR